MQVTTIFLLLSALGGVTAEEIRNARDISLSANQAKRFIDSLFGTKEGLKEECYSEICDFEEVNEVFENKNEAYEYYYTFTCKKFGKNCKVKCQPRKDCSFGSWGSWSGRRGSSECFTQRRYKPYKHPIQTVYQRRDCKGLHTSCPRSPFESRNYCNCKKAVCKLGTWSSWIGIIPAGSCTTQRRLQPYLLSWTTEVKVGSCANVNKKCKKPEVDERKRCSCKKVLCSLQAWGTWSGSVRQGECGTQTRTRSYGVKFTYEERGDCTGVKQDCPVPITEKRYFCSCKFVTCKLGPWSDWEPIVLQKGMCGQGQHRSRKYLKSLAYEDHVGSCPSLPQKCPEDVIESRKQCICAYRDSCTLKDWTKWSEDLTEVGCKIQIRTRKYLSPLKHAQSEDCKGLHTECVKEPKETRTFCKCKYSKCKLGKWSEWSNKNINDGSCEQQTRTQSYIAQNAVVEKVGGCGGLPTECPENKQETRSMCKCKTVKCDVLGWGEWQGDIPLDTCSTQERKKTVITTERLHYQEKPCDDLPTTCGAPPTESRKMCNCSYREDCTLKEWGAWNGEVPDQGCEVQIRTREYNKSITYVESESCSGLNVCPAIRDETRTKCNCNQVICEWTAWFRNSFDPKTKCYEEIRVQNKSAGFQKLHMIGSCDDVHTLCSNNNIERRKDCLSKGGRKELITSPSPTTQPETRAPTTAFKPATFVSLGCFADKGKNSGKLRPLPMLYENARSSIDWFHMEKTVQRCADVAKEKRYEYFGIQFFGECWSGPNASKTYARDGPSDKCLNGVGQAGTNAVYRVEDMPACSKELTFKAQASSGVVTNNAWCAGNENKYQWIVVNLEKARKISGIGTQGANKDNWVTTYLLEYSKDNKSWLPYQEGKQPKVFAGNSDRFTLETHWFKFPINVQFLRFKPQSWSSTHICMKVRVYGCDV